MTDKQKRFVNGINRNQEGQKQKIDIKAEHFSAVHTIAENRELDGIPVLRVVKNEKIEKWDENTYAKLNGVSFHNGVIEVKMLSRLLPDAPVDISLDSVCPVTFL